MTSKKSYLERSKFGIHAREISRLRDKATSSPTIFPRAGKISFRSDKSKKETILFLICVFCQIVYKNIFLFSHFFFFLRKQREEEIETSIERFANFYRRNRET